MVRGFLHRLGGLARQLLVGLRRASHLARLARLGCEQFFQVDRRRGAVGLAGLTAMERPLGDFELEAHDRLVDAADLFHVERAVAQAFAVEDEQVLRTRKSTPSATRRDRITVAVCRLRSRCGLPGTG